MYEICLLLAHLFVFTRIQSVKGFCSFAATACKMLLLLQIATAYWILPIFFDEWWCSLQYLANNWFFLISILLIFEIQWQFSIKLNRNSDSVVHCTGNSDWFGCSYHQILAVSCSDWKKPDKHNLLFLKPFSSRRIFEDWTRFIACIFFNIHRVSMKNLQKCSNERDL